MKLKRLLTALWESTQVELGGKYSTEGLLELTQYTNETSWRRVIAVLLATLLPCLLVTVVIDVLPLADPSEGAKANTMYFVRAYYSYLVFTFLAIHQFHISVPVLPYILGRAIGNTVVVAALTVGILYKLAVVVGFPLPFSVLTVTPPWLTFILIALAIEWGRKIRDTPGAAKMLINSLKLWICQVLLVILYPSFFYLFTTLSKEGKTAFAMLLPFIKLFMKNLFARTVVHLRDETPEVVVFNAELFNALFVSYCMQNSPSLWITLEIMIFDAVMMAFSLRGAVRARRSLRDLERKIERHQSWDSFHERASSRSRRSNVGLRPYTTTLSTTRRSSTRLTTLDRASMILLVEQTPGVTKFSSFARLSTIMPSSTPTSKVSDNVTSVRKKAANKVMSKKPLSFVDPRSYPMRMAKAFFGSDRIHPVFEADENGLHQLSVRYTRTVQQLVYAAEFLLLLNYVEVVIPFVFSIYLFVMYHLPNRDYYSQLHGMDHNQLVHTLQSVQFYCFLQLVSLLILFYALQHLLGLSPIHQLAFVLEKRYSGVQLKLVFWVFYNAQASLQHSGKLSNVSHLDYILTGLLFFAAAVKGYDYSFQFPWLQQQSAPISDGSTSS